MEATLILQETKTFLSEEELHIRNPVAITVPVIGKIITLVHNVYCLLL
jgi:hypothetical protein